MPVREELIVLDEDAVMRLWLQDKLHAKVLTEAQADVIWRRYRDPSKKVADNLAVADDMRGIYRLMHDMRTPFGRVVYKRYGGKLHVILKGNPRIRRILTAPRYGVRNAKVVSMGIGVRGAVASAKGGTILTIVFVTAWRVFDHVMRDESTLGQLLGGVAADVSKAVIAGAIGAAVGAAAGGFAVVAAFAAGPLVVAVIAGVVASYYLDQLDTKFKLTEKTQAAFVSAVARLSRILEDTQRAVKRTPGQILDAARDAVIDLVADAVRGQVRRLAPSVPSFPQLR